MGYGFDDNGKYIKWSDLFDYSSIKTLQASEYLPYPDNVEYKKNDSGIDISEDIKSIAAKTDKAEKIMEYASLLSRLQEIRPTYERQQTSENKENKGRVLGKFRYITWDNTIDDSIANEVLNNLNIHARTYISPYNEQKGLKNFMTDKSIESVKEVTGQAGEQVIDNAFENNNIVDAEYDIQMEKIPEKFAEEGLNNTVKK